MDTASTVWELDQMIARLQALRERLTLEHYERMAAEAGTPVFASRYAAVVGPAAHPANGGRS